MVQKVAIGLVKQRKVKIMVGKFLDGVSVEAGDCDDSDPAMHPGAIELCDGVDNNCDGIIDDDATDQSIFYRDRDGDGFGDDYEQVKKSKPDDANSKPKGAAGDVWGVRGDLSDSQNTENFLQSPEDRNFRPTDFEIGSDGALYVSDWQNIIIGHMQHNVRDPSRDHKYGRVYRVTHEGRPLMKHIKVDGEPISRLLDLLKERTNLTRHRARIELSKRETSAVMSELAKWVKQWNPKKTEHAHHLMEALWLHQQGTLKIQ